MKNSNRLLLGALTSITIVISSCESFAPKEAFLDTAANFVIEKYQKASCEEVAKMQSPQSTPGAKTSAGKNATLDAKAIETLQKNPEIRQEFINRVAGPIANKMFECNLIP